MKKMPLGIQNFREIVSGGYVYVDKTQYVYSLLNEAKYYFLSRPRRFGKSLLLDTIAEAFSGDRELFKGLFIYDSDYGFEEHPVLRIDMSNIANKTPEILESSLSTFLMERVVDEGLEISGTMPSDIFRQLIRLLHNKYGKKVVVLIDEYDKPILDHLADLDTAEANRGVIKGFYGVLKSMDPHLRLTFITGVSKFTKTSIFSEMNNLLDITLTSGYSNICGIEIEGLDRHFSGHIEHLAQLEDFCGYSSLRDEILAWYDGYSWDGKTRVINPFSLLSFFVQKRFFSYWYSSGTPTFLIRLLREKPSSFLALKNLKMGEWELDSVDILKMEAAPLLFQTGYLTITEVAKGMGSPVYLLDMPNYEVREVFNLHLLAEFTEIGSTVAGAEYRQIKGSLQTGDPQGMLQSMRALFASIPYQLHVSQEAYYHSIFYAILNLLGFEVGAEVSVSGGRVDAVLELGDKVYVMEFKYVGCPQDASPEEKQKLFDRALSDAMGQIKDRGYAKKYEGSGKAVHQVAFAFLGRDDIEMMVDVVK